MGVRSGAVMHVCVFLPSHGEFKVSVDPLQDAQAVVMAAQELQHYCFRIGQQSAAMRVQMLVHSF